MKARGDWWMIGAILVVMVLVFLGLLAWVVYREVTAP